LLLKWSQKLRAILSDIHGNLEALTAVLSDIADHSVSRIYCLGDVVGYGPNPIECLELALKWDLTLLGNHDSAVLVEPDGFCKSAEAAIFWTQSVLERDLRWDLWKFLEELPRSHQEGNDLFVHGSPHNPINEYVFPEDVYNQRKMERIFAKVNRCCYQGHTHVPGIFNDQMQFITPGEVGFTYKLDSRKTLVNVGSVGQPRDENWRACYVLVDGLDVTFRRVEYDVDATVRKIYDIAELHDFHGDRLREGR